MAEVPPHLRTRLADMLAGGPSTANSSLADMAALRPSWETNATPLSRMAEAYQGAEARSYSPSFSERVGNSLQDLFMAGGMQPYPAGHLGRSLRDLVQISPLGVPMAVGDFQHARQQGDMLGSVLNATALIPGAKALRIKSLTLPDVAAAVQGTEPVFARWSRGPKFDLDPKANSFDQVARQHHEGLSTVPLAGLEGHELIKGINDYSFLRAKDPSIRPHLYRGDTLGRDSDGGTLLRPKEYLGTISDDLVKLMDNDSWMRKNELENLIAREEQRLNWFSKNPLPWGVSNSDVEKLALDIGKMRAEYNSIKF